MFKAVRFLSVVLFQPVGRAEAPVGAVVYSTPVAGFTQKYLEAIPPVADVANFIASISNLRKYVATYVFAPADGTTGATYITLLDENGIVPVVSPVNCTQLDGKTLSLVGVFWSAKLDAVSSG